LEIPSEVMMAKKIPDPAGNELRNRWSGTDTEIQTLSIHIYTRRSMQVDSRILEKSWGWSWGAHGEPAWRPHCACIAAKWLGTWQYLKVGRLGSQTRSLCKLALVLGRESFAVLNVAPDVDVGVVIARAWSVGG
jgi:hypothetical protein